MVFENSKLKVTKKVESVRGATVNSTGRGSMEICLPRRDILFICSRILGIFSFLSVKNGDIQSFFYL